MPTFRIFSVPKIVLFIVAPPEDPKSECMDGENHTGPEPTKLDMVEGEVPCLEGIGERNPSQSSK